MFENTTASPQGKHQDFEANINAGLYQVLLSTDSPFKNHGNEIPMDNHYDDDISGKANRVVAGVAKGIYEGIAEDIESLIHNPEKALPGLAIGAITAACWSLPYVGPVVRILPSLALGSAAMEIRPYSERMSSAISGAWEGTKSLNEVSKDLRPLGHMAVTYGIARMTTGYSYSIGREAELGLNKMVFTSSKF